MALLTLLTACELPSIIRTTRYETGQRSVKSLLEAERSPLKFIGSFRGKDSLWIPYIVLPPMLRAL